MLGASIGITTDRWRFMKTVGLIRAWMLDGTNTLSTMLSGIARRRSHGFDD